MPPADGCGSYEVVREGEEITLRVSCESCPFFPSIEDEPRAMAMVVRAIAEAGAITRLILTQKRDFEYDLDQTHMLVQVAHLFRTFSKQKNEFGIITDPNCRRFIAAQYTEMQNILLQTLPADPLGAYVELVRMARHERSHLDNGAVSPQAVKCHEQFLALITQLIGQMDQTRLIALAKPQLPGLQVGDRKIYRTIFRPIIKPDFLFTKVSSAYPDAGEALASYSIGETDVTVFGVPNTIQYLYHIVPPEFKLSDDKYALLDEARKVLSEYKPKRSEFIDPERMREVFANVGADLLDDLAGQRNVRLLSKDRDILTDILVRYTVGFGLLEVLLDDEKVQDITVNSPLGRLPIFIVHGEFGDCYTNIVPTIPESESWASKLRLISGRPLDEANPILDTELVLPRSRARVAAITAPLNPSGLAFAMRRHRDKPWTLPLFLKAKMLTPLAAGLLSFLIDGGRTLLVAGTRSAGKTSLLGSLMTELMRRGRVITIEDTLELPVEALRAMQYNVQQMKVASALTRGTTEVSADEGIRTTLRLGDSALVVGEVRSTEAKALYEAMRVGALANVVMGTIHGDSPYGVFDRVVNDLEVPRTSFKATDIIIVANPVRSADGIRRFRRVTQITEVRKHWEEDPLREGGFVDLFRYDAKIDALVPTNDLIAGDSEILKGIAANVREWAGNWDAVWDNIQLRAKIKQTILETAEALKRPELLEAEFVVQSNDEFHRAIERVQSEVGSIDTKRVFQHWQEWLSTAVRRSA